jgi:hypothetical protein
LCGVAIEGGTCVIGSFGTNSYTGSAYVFTSDASGNWNQVTKLTASDGVSNDTFGAWVAIAGDTCVIGASGTNSNAGSAYVFTSDASGNWNQVAQLTASDGASGDAFGICVAIAGDTCVIGASGTNSNAGSAYVFTSDASGNWNQVAQLTASDGVGDDNFGACVAIEGDTCVIGAAGTNSNAGSAYVYGSTAAETGACCVSSGCAANTSDDCTDLGGTWLGEGAECGHCPAPCIADIVVNDQVDVHDLMYLLEQWGPCP